MDNQQEPNAYIKIQVKLILADGNAIVPGLPPLTAIPTNTLEALEAIADYCSDAVPIYLD
jgi:hypothetical protein